jgi:hypothetical protein
MQRFGVFRMAPRTEIGVDVVGAAVSNHAGMLVWAPNHQLIAQMPATSDMTSAMPNVATTMPASSLVTEPWSRSYAYCQTIRVYGPSRRAQAQSAIVAITETVLKVDTYLNRIGNRNEHKNVVENLGGVCNSEPVHTISL